MVTIRLARFGKRQHPTYRVVVSDKRKDTVGPYLEQLGIYNPHESADKAATLNAERVKYWLGVGATVSPSVHNLLVASKLMDAKTIPLGTAKKAEVAEGEAKTPEVKAEEAPKAEAKAEAAPEAKTEEPKPEAKAEEPKKEAEAPAK